MALGIPSGADLAEARGYAHRRVEQNLLGLVVLVFVELGVFPTFAHDATRLAAGETVASARVAAETVYDATVGTDCVRCRERAARDAGRTLEDVAAKLDALGAQARLYRGDLCMALPANTDDAKASLATYMDSTHVRFFDGSGEVEVAREIEPAPERRGERVRGSDFSRQRRRPGSRRPRVSTRRGLSRRVGEFIF